MVRMIWLTATLSCHTHPGLSSHGWSMLMGAASTQARGYPLLSHQPPINASACPCLHSLPEQLAEPLLHTHTQKDTLLVHYPALYQGDGNLCLSSCQFPILFLPGIFQIKAVFVVIPSVRWNIPYLWGNSTGLGVKIWDISEVTNGTQCWCETLKIFSNCIFLVRIMVDPKPIPETPGTRCEYILDGTPDHHRATCTR